MADSRQYWMDEVLRQVAEDNMNPDDRSLGMARALTAEEEARRDAVLAEREEPYMGNLGRVIGAIRDFTFPSGPQVPLAGIRGVTPTVGAGDLPNVAKDMALPLLASDLGVAGAMANVPIPFPGMGKKPVQAGAKKFVPRKKPYKSKTDPIAEATSRISDDYQFLDSTSKGKVARAGLSKGHYQQLLDDGYDFDRIMKEHPRLSPEEWVDIEDVAGRPETFKTSPTPKTARKPQTELGSHYGKMADDSGYTKIVAGNDPDKVQAFYDILDLKSGQSSVEDFHAIFKDIQDYATGSRPAPVFDWKATDLDLLANNIKASSAVQGNTFEQFTAMNPQVKSAEQLADDLDDLLG
jgi:hypothetical protein